MQKKIKTEEKKKTKIYGEAICINLYQSILTISFGSMTKNIKCVQEFFFNWNYSCEGKKNLCIKSYYL